MTWQTSYEDSELYRPQGYFRRTLGIRRVPSCATLRHRLDANAGQFDAVLKTVNVVADGLGQRGGKRRRYSPQRRWLGRRPVRELDAKSETQQYRVRRTRRNGAASDVNNRVGA